MANKELKNKNLIEEAKKYIVRLNFGTDLTPAEEAFGTEQEAIDYLQDQYDNFYFDDEDIAENIIFPLLTRAQEHD